MHATITAQRRCSRRRSGQFCPAWFDLNGRTYKLVVIDLSATGAKLLSVGGLSAANLGPGDRLNLTVWTPCGVTTCMVELRWAQSDGGEACYGVKFLELGNDKNDPLCRTIAEISSCEPCVAI